MRRLALVLIPTLLMLMVATLRQPTTAQDVCDYQTTAGTLLTAADELLTSDAPDEVLQALTAQLAQFRAECAGWSFNSETSGQSAVIGPVTFPDGFYRVAIEGAALSSLEVTEIEGDCGEGFMYILPDATEAESVSEMETCTALLEIDGQGDWTLIYEKLG